MTPRMQQIGAGVAQVAASAQPLQRSFGEVAAVADQSSASSAHAPTTAERATAPSEQIAASEAQPASAAEALGLLVGRFQDSACPSDRHRPRC
jgi:methyl-accepting chemotaxis protein